MARVSSLAICINALAPATLAAPPVGSKDRETTTPIKHVIVIDGENRSFDHTFGLYRPRDEDQTVR